MHDYSVVLHTHFYRYTVYVYPKYALYANKSLPVAMATCLVVGRRHCLEGRHDSPSSVLIGSMAQRRPKWLTK